MKKRVPLILIGLFLFLSWGLGFWLLDSGLAQTSAGLVRPDPLMFEVGQGQVERLALVLEDARDVYGMDVRARFDPVVVEIVDVDEGQEGVQMIPGEFPKPDFLVRNQVDNSAGTLMYVITQVNPSPPANGNGVIVWIEVRGKRMGESPFIVEFVDAADREGRTLQIEKQDGVIRVVKPKPPTPTATIEVTPTEAAELPEVQPTKAKKPKQTPQVTPTLLVTEESHSQKVSINQVLLVVAGGTLVGAVVLLGYASYLSRKPKH